MIYYSASTPLSERLLSERGRGMRLIQRSADDIFMVGGELTMLFPLKEDAHARS